jgi:DeoR family glycerol-3-phosphate regulon repressor
VVGDATVEFISRFKVDFGIIGIGGFDADGSLLDFDHRDVRVSQAILANSRQTFLVADHSKFGRNAMARVGNLAAMDAFFTDAPPPPSTAALIAAAGVRLYVAAGDAAAAPAEAVADG